MQHNKFIAVTVSGHHSQPSDRKRDSVRVASKYGHVFGFWRVKPKERKKTQKQALINLASAPSLMEQAAEKWRAGA